MNIDLKKIKRRIPNILNSDLNRVKEIKKILKNYDLFDFLKSVSALMLFPENQSKSIIFQCMISTALSMEDTKFNLNNKMSYGKFKQIVKMFGDMECKKMVDPPEFPFVLPVMYYENYHLFMGTNSLSPLNLNAYLKVLSVHKDKIDVANYRKLNLIIKGMFKISENVYSILDIDFGELKSFDKDNEIYIPNQKDLEAYKEKITYSREFLEGLFQETIDELKINFGSVSESEVTNFEEQKFYLSPFLNYEDEYILLDITIILNLIMSKLLKYTSSCEEFDFVAEYNKYCCILLEKDFNRLGNYKIKPDGFDIELIKNENYSESLYSSGNDGIIINCNIFDNGKKYNYFKFANCFTCPLEKSFISDRIKYLTSKLVESGLKEDKIFTIVTPNTIGRDMYFSLTDCDMRNIIILGFYEINAISINESDKNMFLQRYIIARKRLKHYEKNLFSELNIISLYAKKDYSFYLGDDVDTKEALLYIIGEYSADYIKQAYSKEDIHLCQSFEHNKLIEVIKFDRNIYFAPGLFYERQLNKVVKINKFLLWIITDNYIKEDLYQIYNFVMDLISFWFAELHECLKQYEFIQVIKLSVSESEEKFYEVQKSKKDISEILKYDIKENCLELIINSDIYDYLYEDGNEKEKELIKYIINILYTQNKILTIEDSKVEEVFKNQYKKKAITIDLSQEPYLIPTMINDYIEISHSDENIILDDIGNFISQKEKIKYGIIEDSKILNEIVEYLYLRLKEELMKYEKNDLIMYLYYEYEKVLAKLSIRHKFYAYDTSCYPEHINKINSNFNELNKSSVSLKFLIELSSSIKNNGHKNISEYEIEFLLAIASQIIEWAYSNDLFYYKMINQPIQLLKSNRLGFDRDFIEKSSFSLFKARTEKMGVIGKENLKRLSSYINEKVNDEKYNFEECFKKEFGYTFKDYIQVTIFLLDCYSDDLNKYDEIKSMSINEIIENLKGKVEQNVVLRILDSLSLQEREDFLTPPKPYRKEDIYPWRFNRTISFNRKPLIIYAGKVILGYRMLSNSIYFLFELISEGRLNAYSDEMKKYISNINNLNGKEFNDQVYNYIIQSEDLIVRKNVKKINGIRISDENNNDLGDIDILYISEKKGIIVVAETKKLSLAKNFYEIHQEYYKMFDRDNKKSFINKHLKRVEWIKEHIDDVKLEFGLTPKKWKVKYMFIVDDYLISKDTFKIKEKIITLNNLTENELLKF